MVDELLTVSQAAERSGLYFHGSEEHAPNALVNDAAAVERLWEMSEELVGL